MKLYLCGASSEIDLVESYMAKLRAAGRSITLDWCAAIRASARSDHELDHEERRAHAATDLEGVRNARIVWLLAPTPPNVSTGCWVECGHAIAYRATKTLIASGHVVPCIFADMADKMFRTHQEAFDWIVGENI